MATTFNLPLCESVGEGCGPPPPPPPGGARRGGGGVSRSFDLVQNAQFCSFKPQEQIKLNSGFKCWCCSWGFGALLLGGGVGFMPRSERKEVQIQAVYFWGRVKSAVSEFNICIVESAVGQNKSLVGFSKAPLLL